MPYTHTPRNLTDEQMKAYAHRGGGCGVSGTGMYIGGRDAETEAVFRHIDYMVELIGPEHVGLGLNVIFNGEALNAWFRARPDERPFAQDPNWSGAKTVVPE